MIGLIIDITAYPSLNLIKPPYEGNLLFVVIPESVFKKLENKPKGRERETFFNSHEFLQSVVFHMCTEYDNRSKIIRLKSTPKPYTQLFIDTVHLNFEDSVRVVAPFDDALIEKGFDSPTVCKEDGSICLQRKNKYKIDMDVKKEKAMVMNDLLYIENQKKKVFCDIFLKIDMKSLRFLKHLTRAGVTKTPRGRSQKEFYGEFRITDAKIEGKGKRDIVYCLTLDKTSLISGEEEKIEASGSVYNFHSHPYQAYLKHNVKYGVPSIADYTSVYILSKRGTIIHFVATLEGVYAISINPDFHILKKDDEQVIDFIETKMPFERDDLSKYLKHVNNVGLFQVELLPYEKSVKVHARFHKKGKFKNCETRDT